MERPRRPARQRSGKQRPLTAETLNKAALHYLERYANSAEGLRRVLLRRVDKAARENRCEPDAATVWVDEIIARFLRAGLIDDRTYAAGRTASLRRQGESARRIALKLREKGVDGEIVQTALTEEDGEDADAAEFAAACRFARRRRLGPMREGEQRRERHERDLAALARAGFTLDTARRVLALEDADALIDAAV